MVRHAGRFTLVLAAGIAAAPALAAQGEAARGAPPHPFYAGIAPVEFTLTLNLRLVRADTMDDPPSRAATVTVRGAAGSPVELPVRLKTHGRWRLTHCDFPPLTLNFGDAPPRDTPFAGLDKARMTSVCRNTLEYEQYILQELQLYRAYHLLTPWSQASRLVRVTWVDSASRRTVATRYGFFIEDRDAMAARLRSAWMKAEGAIASDLSPDHTALMGVFEYLIGNTDFHLGALHNVLLLGSPAGEIVPVAFDFDYAGAVNTSYAVPNPVLRIRSVRDRLFRGPCATAESFAKTFALFQEQRPAINALYADPVGRLLRGAIVTDTRKYFDEFYRVIGDTALARVEILERCVK